MSDRNHDPSTLRDLRGSKQPSNREGPGFQIRPHVDRQLRPAGRTGSVTSFISTQTEKVAREEFPKINRSGDVMQGSGGGWEGATGGKRLVLQNRLTVTAMSTMSLRNVPFWKTLKWNLASFVHVYSCCSSQKAIIVPANFTESLCHSLFALMCSLLASCFRHKGQLRFYFLIFLKISAQVWGNILYNLVNPHPVLCLTRHFLKPHSSWLPVNYHLNQALLRWISQDASVPQRLEQSKHISKANRNNKKTRRAERCFVLEKKRAEFKCSEL